MKIPTKLMIIMALTSAFVFNTCKEPPTEEGGHDLHSLANVSHNIEVQAPLCGLQAMPDVPDLAQSEKLQRINRWILREGILNERAKESQETLQKVLMHMPVALMAALDGFDTKIQVVDSTPEQCTPESWDTADSEFAKDAAIEIETACFHAEQDAAPVIYFIAEQDAEVSLKDFGFSASYVFGEQLKLEEFAIRSQLIRLAGLIYTRYMVDRARGWINEAEEQLASGSLNLAVTESGELETQKNLMQDKFDEFDKARLEFLDIFVGNADELGEAGELSEQYEKLRSVSDRLQLADYVYAEALNSYYCNSFTKQQFIENFPDSFLYFYEVLRSELE